MSSPGEQKETAGIDRGRLREAILEAAIDLLTQGGREAVTTRAVAAAAGTQGPTIYRLFGDKRGLLDAVEELGFQRYLTQKVAPDESADPLETLRRGWEVHVDFGLSHPALFSLMYGEPRPGHSSPAARRGFEILRGHLHRLAQAGQLKVSEARAVEMIHSAGCGTVFTLLAQPVEERDPGLSSAMFDSVLGAVLASAQPRRQTDGAAVAAVTLHARLAEVDRLSAGEKLLLGEWLERIADSTTAL